MATKALEIQQLNRNMARGKDLKRVMPELGWSRAVRTSLGMSLAQLGRKLSITKQSVRNLELREQQGSITIKALTQLAHAMDMDLVYGFIPKDGSLQKLINRKANDLAAKIVARTAATMSLENQSNSVLRLQQATKERAEQIKQDLPSSLWD